jgi:thioredoxin 1
MDAMADSQNVVTVTDENFEQQIVNAPGLAMVDFWATWCGPCRMIAPIVQQLADEYAGQVTVGKMDVDANQQVAATFGIRSIPTILFFKDGKMVEQVVGAVPRPALESKIKQLLA